MNIKISEWMKQFLSKKKEKVSCKDCLQSLQLVVDGEASVDQEKFFMEHLDQCKPCYHHYNLEKAVKSVLKNKLEKVPAPTSLSEKIRSKIKLNNPLSLLGFFILIQFIS